MRLGGRQGGHPRWLNPGVRCPSSRPVEQGRQGAQQATNLALVVYDAPSLVMVLLGMPNPPSLCDSFKRMSTQACRPNACRPAVLLVPRRAHAGGGGSKHASLDGHGFLGWLAGKVGPMPPCMARGKGGPSASSPRRRGERPAAGPFVPAARRTIELQACLHALRRPFAPATRRTIELQACLHAGAAHDRAPSMPPWSRPPWMVCGKGPPASLPGWRGTRLAEPVDCSAIPAHHISAGALLQEGVRDLVVNVLSHVLVRELYVAVDILQPGRLEPYLVVDEAILMWSSPP
jgi:hypothetical protein